MNRRFFLSGITSLAAPAIIPAGILMPARKVWVPTAADMDLLDDAAVALMRRKLIDSQLSALGFVDSEIRMLNALAPFRDAEPLQFRRPPMVWQGYAFV